MFSQLEIQFLLKTKYIIRCMYTAIIIPKAQINTSFTYMLAFQIAFNILSISAIGVFNPSFWDCCVSFETFGSFSPIRLGPEVWFTTCDTSCVTPISVRKRIGVVEIEKLYGISKRIANIIHIHFLHFTSYFLLINGTNK